MPGGCDVLAERSVDLGQDSEREGILDRSGRTRLEQLASCQ
jgi:hypothetical protein